MNETALSDREREALAAARRAQERAYAPYSQKKVGAAVITRDGTIFPGCNVENQEDALGVCAERNAVATAVAAGYREFRTVVVAAPDGRLWPPCKLCRAVLSEFNPEVMVIMANGNGDTRRGRLDTLDARPFEPNGDEDEV